jgi:DNA polymerase-2
VVEAIQGRASSKWAPPLVAYLVTVNGPEPEGELRSAIDYEHYVQKQVRAVCAPVLDRIGLDFDRVIGDRVQLDLFP